MNQIELCHWLLQEPSGNCRSVFAPAGDYYENYRRVGAAASSEQFVFAVCYAVNNAFQPPCVASADRIEMRFVIQRDEREARDSAFLGMEALKVAALISELSSAIAQWVQNVGCRFHAISILDTQRGEISLEFEIRDESPLAKQRALQLTKAGIEMMAYARGLKVSNWNDASQHFAQ